MTDSTTATDGIIRWGIIGAGDVCERKSGPPLYQLPTCELVAITRRDATAGADFAQRHGPCHYEPSIEALVAREDIDAIYVATPDAHHHAGTLAAAAAGKHVLVEKAMASNTAECDDMIAACAQAGVQLAVAYYRRCYPTVLTARQLIADGAIGRLERIWINDQFPTSHRIDLCHFFAGDIASIQVDTRDLWPDHNAARGPVLTAQHHSGASSVLAVDWCENHDIEQVVLDGSEGRLVISDLKAGGLKLSRGWDCEHHDQPALPFAHWGLMANTADALLGRAQLACDGIEGRKSTVILDRIDEAGKAIGEKLSVTY